MQEYHRQELMRLRDTQRRTFERLEKVERAVQRVESAAQSAAKDAGRLEEILLNGGKGKIKNLEDRLTLIASHYDQRLKPIEKLCYTALGASAMTPVLLALLGLALNLGWIQGPAKP